jgi:tetratricopeptide (TPR) repeat protein
MALGLVAVLFLAITVSQVLLWRDETALWMESARLSPNQLRPRLELAERLAPAQAVELLEDTSRMWSGDARIHAALGLAYNRAGRRDEAVRTVEYALKQAPCETAVRQAALALGIQPPACEATGPER